MAETLTRAHPHRKNYTDDEIDAGLTALALYSGQRRRAAEALRQAGTPIPATTLDQWRRKDPERYERAQQQAAPQVRARLADKHESLVDQATEIEARMLTRLSAELDEIPTKDLPNSTKALSVTTGIHSEKGLLYRGEPTQIIQRDLTALRRALGSKGFVLEGTAVEVSNGVSVDATKRPEQATQKQLPSST